MPLKGIRMETRTQVLIVGAGPAGLATALYLAREFEKLGFQREISVIEKAIQPSGNILSGGLIPSGYLDELLLKEDRDRQSYEKEIGMVKVAHDKLMFLLPKFNIPAPDRLLPSNLKHGNDCIVQAGALVSFLYDECVSKGIHIYNGLPANSLLIRNGKPAGVVIPESGNKHPGGLPGSYKPEETILADIIILAEGCRGPLSQQLIDTYDLAKDKSPQIYSVGVKQRLKLTGQSEIKAGTVFHFLGYPLKVQAFGGGFLYAHSSTVVDIGLLLALDNQSAGFDPNVLLEKLKAHPFVNQTLGDYSITSGGSKTLPEGGLASLPRPGAHTTIMTGDSLGTVDISRFKGLHLAIESGKVAASAVIKFLTDDNSPCLADIYAEELGKSCIVREMAEARNFRQVFNTSFGILAGAPLSVIQRFFPFQLPNTEDHKHIRKKDNSQPDFINKDKLVFQSSAHYDEEMGSHIHIIDPGLCSECVDTYQTRPCVHFCPGGVYSSNEDGTSSAPSISYIHCMHCKSCLVRCPKQNIRWEHPPAGNGPVYEKL